jgi:hypothetical protein
MWSALQGVTVPRESLTGPQRARMLALMQVCYAGICPERFGRDLDEKQYVILLYARRTGELAGFSTLRVTEERVEGRAVEVVFSGDTVIHPDHWGQKELQVRFGFFMLARKLRRPRRPLHWLLLSGGYKTYLLAVNHFPRTLPRHDWEAPAERWSLLHALATRWFGPQYDAARGTVRFSGEHYHVRQGVAPIDREAAAQPHIAFFTRHNPGHVEGEELVCLVEVRLRDLVRALCGLSMKRLALLMSRGLRWMGVRARA